MKSTGAWLFIGGINFTTFSMYLMIIWLFRFLLSSWVNIDHVYICIAIEILIFYTTDIKLSIVSL